MSSEGRAEADEGTHWSNHKENKKQIRARISFYICNMFQCHCAYKDGFSISSGVIKTFSCGSFSCACVHDQNSQRRPNAGRKRELRKELQVMLRAFRWVHSLRHLIFPLLSHSRGARLFIKSRTKLSKQKNISTKKNFRANKSISGGTKAFPKLILPGGPSVASDVILTREQYFYGTFIFENVTQRPPVLMLGERLTA